MEMDSEFDSVNIEIRKLSPASLSEISRILGDNNSWKVLMSQVPGEGSSYKYTTDHIQELTISDHLAYGIVGSVSRLIQLAGETQKRFCSEIFLEEWGTSGRVRPKLSDLLELLVKVELFRAADYVATQLLKRELPQRPLKGPAALVDVPCSSTLPLVSPTPKPSAPPPSSNPTCEQSVNSNSPTVAINDVLFPLEVAGASNVPHFKFSQLEAGCQGFSESLKLGGGAFGVVFKCTLPHQKIVAVKKLFTSKDLSASLFPEFVDEVASTSPAHPSQQFKNEIEFLSKFSHPNLLPLVGYSADGPHLCLLYNYMENGSLLDTLGKKDPSNILDWEQRYNISLGTAHGLQYLHTEFDKPLVHRDVKSANILLDTHLNAKISDFGLTRVGSSGNTKSFAKTSTVVGTSAYMAPEAFRGDVSSKMDVFSFGVVLLELVTGLPPYDEDRDGCDLVSHVDGFEFTTSLIDSRPPAHSVIPYQLYEVAQNCLLEKKSRPDITSIVQSLKTNMKES